MLLAYFGPETTLPATSTIAALVGFVLMGSRWFGQGTLRALRLFPGWLRRLRLLADRRWTAVGYPGASDSGRRSTLQRRGVDG